MTSLLKQILPATIISLTLMILNACNNNINLQHPVPHAPVDCTINIMRDAPALDVLGNSFVITRPLTTNQYIGYAGLVIVHGLDDTFYAFDLCCPHEHTRNIRVESSMISAKCPKCGSTFDIGFGTGAVSAGPSAFPLKRYRVTQSGYYLHITP